MKRTIFIIRIIAGCVGIIFFIRTFSYHAAIISLNSPQEYREDSPILITQRILDHKPIFTADAMPAYTNGYGMLYNYIVAIPASLFGNSYVLHRLVTAIFIFISLLWLYKIGVKYGADRLALFLALLILYHYAVFDFAQVGPRADSVGLLLFFMTVFIPWSRKFSVPSLLLSVLTSILAFYAKPYFVLGIAYVGLYLLLKKDFKKCFVVCGSWACGFGLTAVWVHHTYDFYFFNTITMFGRLIQYMWWYFKLQTKDYITANLALFLTSLVPVFIFVRSVWRKEKLIKFPVPDYLIYCLILSWVVIVVRLGGNAGNYLTYYNELISPFMVLATCIFWNKRKSIVLIALFFITISWLLMRVNFSVNTEAIIQNRDEWQRYLNAYNSIFPAPVFSYYVNRRNLPVYDAGQAEYFPQGIPKDNSSIAKIATQRYTAQIEDLEKKITNNEFDLLMYMVPYTTGVGNLMYSGYLKDYVKTHYRYNGIKKVITAYQTLDMELWVPQR